MLLTIQEREWLKETALMDHEFDRKVKLLLTDFDALTEWRLKVSEAVKSIPEFSSGSWPGDKEGWRFHVALINWLQRRRNELEAKT